MDLADVIIAVLCVIDDLLPVASGQRRVRQRGPAPLLADSAVLTMEVVGAYLGSGGRIPGKWWAHTWEVVGEDLSLRTDSGIVAYVREHWTHVFPALAHLHRTTFTHQAANLWALKERLWHALLAQTSHDPALALVDSVPLSVCPFARAYRCRRFRGEATYGCGQGYAAAPDLLRVSRACAPVLAGPDHPRVPGPGPRERPGGAA